MCVFPCSIVETRWKGAPCEEAMDGNFQTCWSMKLLPLYILLADISHQSNAILSSGKWQTFVSHNHQVQIDSLANTGHWHQVGDVACRRRSHERREVQSDPLEYKRSNGFVECFAEKSSLNQVVLVSTLNSRAPKHYQVEYFGGEGLKCT